MLNDHETLDWVVERYLNGVGGDASEAVGALTHDGPEGARVPDGVWEAAVGILVAQLDEDRPEGGT